MFGRKKVEGKDLWKSGGKLPKSSKRTDRKYEKATGRNPRKGTQERSK